MMVGTPCRMIVFVTGCTRICALSGTCLMQTRMWSAPGGVCVSMNVYAFPVSALSGTKGGGTGTAGLIAS
jgi:hypothetical protein